MDSDSLGVVIVERTENPVWLSNAYLVADEAGGTGVLIDGNDELGPLLERAERDGIEITHVLVTHPHGDHVAGLAGARAALDDPPLVAHPECAAELPDELTGGAGTGGHTETSEDDGVTGNGETTGDVDLVLLGDGDVLDTGGLHIEAIHTPGHAAGHLAFLISPAESPSSAEGSSSPTGGDESSPAPADLFTADVLFKGTVGGTMAPGASGFADLKASVMRLMDLPPATRIHPGHRKPTTIGDEREHNPFVRVWRGLAETGDERVTVWDRPATLKLWAPDYDGGNKAWIVFEDDGLEAIVGGSQVVRA